MSHKCFGWTTLTMVGRLSGFSFLYFYCGTNEEESKCCPLFVLTQQQTATTTLIKSDFIIMIESNDRDEFWPFYINFSIKCIRFGLRRLFFFLFVNERCLNLLTYLYALCVYIYNIQFARWEAAFSIISNELFI